MKKIAITLIALFTLSAVSRAQDLPQPSPKAEVEQAIGLTDFQIKYSRPGVKEREIFGGLVPYGEMWRTGANKATTIKFSTPVNFAGTVVEAGTYSLYTIPNEGVWTVILNGDTDNWGTNGYTSEADVARIEVEAREAQFMETFTIYFNDIRNSQATLNLQWENTLVKIPMKVELAEQVEKNIAKAVSSSDPDKLWRVYRNAANYYHNSNEPERAQEFIDKSLSENESSWYTYYLKAEIMASQEKYGEALELAERAMALGEEEAQKSDEGNFGYAERIARDMEKWESMMQ